MVPGYLLVSQGLRTSIDTSWVRLSRAIGLCAKPPQVDTAILLLKFEDGCDEVVGNLKMS